ncbi:MAG: 5-methyltetrahydropteroyltriglutamate--homocysteine S-methyltransferase [Rhodospirillales bacterium]|jgi:5-methyltetrahydropteroyltriglutamate--homocysteine methyltransferase|nr:5-methyltetrahydropteroyltriglutamate--homocysteine S-methyltransferase [Rhodospirillales bacterium]
MADTAPHNPPFRAEHIGSLVRPQKLVDARRAFEANKLDAASLRAIEDDAIREVVKLQEDIGLEMVTDGEFRRSSYSDSFTVQGIKGISIEMTDEAGYTADAKAGHRMARRIPRVVSKLEWAGPQNAADFKFLKAATTKSTGKITIPGPAYVHYRAGRANISKEVYPDIDNFWSDLVTAYHKELQSLYDAGCTYVQIDETSLVKLGDPRVRELLKERGDDWQDLLKRYVEACNAVARGAPKGMTIGIHICRSQDKNWQADVGYDPIADAIFNQMEIGTYFLEYDNPRSGTFEPLRFVPKNKTVVLGLVGSRTPELEEADLLKRRIEEAAKFVPLDQLALSPHCGFSTGIFMSKSDSIDIEKAKLARVIEVARQMWRN